MISMLMLLMLAPGSSGALAVQSPPELACTAQRLRPFVGPAGVGQAWPVAAGLPSLMIESTEELVTDDGLFADGYTLTLHVDMSARAAYVVQEGGIAGLRTVYGPLPLAWCGHPGESASTSVPAES